MLCVHDGKGQMHYFQNSNLQFIALLSRWTIKNTFSPSVLPANEDKCMFSLKFRLVFCIKRVAFEKVPTLYINCNCPPYQWMFRLSSEQTIPLQSWGKQLVWLPSRHPMEILMYIVQGGSDKILSDSCPILSDCVRFCPIFPTGPRFKIRRNFFPGAK